MTGITIQELHGDDMLEAMYGLNAYALHPSPPLTSSWCKTPKKRSVKS